MAMAKELPAIAGAALRCYPGPRAVAMGQRFCLVCAAPLTGDVLLAQAEELMRPFAGVPIAGPVRDQVAALLHRAANPLHSGIDCCYSCAYDFTEPRPNRVQ